MITKIAPPVIWFEYEGDEVGWNGKQYISLMCLGSFNSLEELDEFWEDFAREMNGST